jgi:hypothetical protein
VSRERFAVIIGGIEFVNEPTGKPGYPEIGLIDG